MKTGKTFISYAHKDKSFVKAFASTIRSIQGNSTLFWDKDIKPGRDWENVLNEELDNCEQLIVFWCCHSAESDWVNYEIDRIRQQGKPILPILLCEFAVSQRIRNFQWQSDYLGIVEHTCGIHKSQLKNGTTNSIWNTSTIKLLTLILSVLILLTFSLIISSCNQLPAQNSQNQFIEQDRIEEVQSKLTRLTVSINEICGPLWHNSDENQEILFHLERPLNLSLESRINYSVINLDWTTNSDNNYRLTEGKLPQETSNLLIALIDDLHKNLCELRSFYDPLSNPEIEDDNDYIMSRIWRGCETDYGELYYFLIDDGIFTWNDSISTTIKYLADSKVSDNDYYDFDQQTTKETIIETLIYSIVVIASISLLFLIVQHLSKYYRTLSIKRKLKRLLVRDLNLIDQEPQYFYPKENENKLYN